MRLGSSSADEIEELKALANKGRVRLQTDLADVVTDDSEPPILFEDLAETMALLAEFERRLGRLVRK